MTISEDHIFPSTNDLGIPDLLLTHMVKLPLPLPFARWNLTKRTTRTGGTCHFYTDDYRFLGLVKSPDSVKNVGYKCFCEANFSTNDTQPLVLVLQEIYKKRWLARYWQSMGFPIIADLAIAPRYREYALIGVPKRWNAYSTYFFPRDNDLLWLEEDYYQARDHCGKRPDIFIVYGGNKELGEEWISRGWLWFPKTQRNILVNTDGTGRDKDG